MPISIRPVTTLEACQTIEQLQAEIWASDDIEIVPDHLLLTIAKEGGIVLLAVDDDEKPVGFAYGFLGLTSANRLKLVSHQAGVLPAYQNSHIGYELKLAQRQIALARGLDCITWTFDPLQSRNAYFNLRRLGAVCHTYIRNLYGEMRDGLNQGLPSDRFRVDWWLASAHVVQRISGDVDEGDLSLSTWPVLNPAQCLADGMLAPPDTFALAHGASCWVEIPADLHHLKFNAPDLALKWREQTRHIFETAFTAGYTAIDLLRHEGRSYFLLQNNWSEVAPY